MHLARSEFAHHVDTRLEVLLLGFQHEIVIRGQRRGVEGGDEDRFRRVAGVGDDAVRALHDHRPKARPEQQGDDLLARSRPEVGLLKLLVLLGGVGSHRHGEDLALLSAVDGSHRTADGRREEHAFVVLVEEQRRAGFHPIALLNQQLGSHALEIEGREGILRSLRRVRERLLGLMSKPLRSVMIFDMVNDFDCYVWNSSSAVSELTINSRAKVRNFSRNSPCANHYFLNLIKIWNARFRDKIKALRMLPMRKNFERIRSKNNLRKTSPRPAGRQPEAKVKKLAPNSQCSR